MILTKINSISRNASLFQNFKAKTMTERKGMKKLPVELKDCIYDLAGPLAKYLNGRLYLSSTFNKRLIRRDAIRIGWRGNYSELFGTSSDDLHDEISDIVINQSKGFHDWLIGHLKSNDKTRAIADKLESMSWEKWWRDTIGNSKNSKLKKHFSTAIENNHVEMVCYIMTDENLRKTLPTDDGRYFLEKFYRHSFTFAGPTDDVFRKSAQSKILWSILRNVKLNGMYDVMGLAAKLGDLEMVKWVHENIGDCCSAQAMDLAAAYGYFDIVKFLHHHRTEGCTIEAMNFAAMNGHFEVLKWLHENRTEGCTTIAMDYAAQNGHFEIVEFLHKNRSEGCTKDAMNWASQNGHLDIVKFLHQNRTEGCSVKAMDFAAKNGHIDVVKWLHEHRTEGCTTNAMDRSAENSHLEVVKFLHEYRSEGCTKYAMDFAAMNGHLEVVKWLHENRTEGCTTKAMDWAEQNGHSEVVKWLQENRPNRT